MRYPTIGGKVSYSYVDMRAVRVSFTGWLYPDGSVHETIPYTWSTHEEAAKALITYSDSPAPHRSEAELAALVVEGW